MPGLDIDEWAFTVSVGISVKSSDVREMNFLWKEFKASLSAAEVGEKDGKYFVRGYCFGNHREDANLGSVVLLVVDCDQTIDTETGELVNGAPPHTILQFRPSQS